MKVINVRGVSTWEMLYLTFWAKYMQWHTKRQAAKLCRKATREMLRAL